MVIPVSLSWMTYNPVVQTFLARMTASYLSERLNTFMRIEAINLTPRLDLKVTGVLSHDNRGDTLFHAREIFLDMKMFKFNQERKVFVLNDLEIEDGSFSLIMGKNDSVFTYSFIRDHFETEDETVLIDTVYSQPDWRVSLNALALKNFRFRYIDENREPIDPGMDYQNLDIYINELKINELSIRNDTFNFAINELKCHDRCGFAVDMLTGDFQLSPLYLVAENLILKTPRSDLDLDLTFTYNGWPSYIWFPEEVEMLSTIRPSELNLKDIGYFAPDILVMDNQLRIGGDVKGKVNNLRVKNFRFAFGNDTRFKGDVRLFGLPDVEETFIHTNVDEFTITSQDAKKFAIPGTYRYIPVPDELEVFGKMSVNGSFTGFFNDFVSNAVFVSDIGTLQTDVSLKQNEEGTDVSYEGNVKAKDFHIGKFLRLDEFFGSMDLDAMVTGKGLTSNTVEINMTGDVDSLMFMGNTFNQVEIRGEIAEKKFNGHLNVDDDLLKLVFDGILDFAQSKPLLDFTAVIDDADLYNLNMLDRDSLLRLSAALNCNFIGFGFDDLEGRIRIDTLEYIEGKKTWSMNYLALISLLDTGYYRKLMLTSDMLDANVSGNYTFRELPHAIDQILQGEFKKWSFIDEPEVPIRNQIFDFDLTIKETDELTDIFAPGLKVANNCRIDGHFNSMNKDVMLNAKFPSVEYQGIRSDSVRLESSVNTKNIKLAIETDHILLKERKYNDTLQLGFEYFKLDCVLNNDSLKFAFGWDDHDQVRHNMADFKGYYCSLDSAYNKLKITRAKMLVNDSLWLMNPDNQVIFGDDYYAFSEFDFIGSKQKLSIHGTISRNPADTFNVDFTQWKLSNFDIIYDNYNFDLNGVADGSVGISNLYALPNFFTNLRINQLEMNDVLIGDALIFSKWNHEKQSVDVDSEVIFHGNIGDSRVVKLVGSYFPERDVNNLDFRIGLENYRIETLSRFVEGYVSDLKGIASGEFFLRGSTRDPALTGSIKLMRTECRIDYLNTRYSLSHSIDFNKGDISFKKLIIYDTLGNQAVADGSISHTNLRDFDFDISVKPKDFIILNTDRYQNSTFYGTGIASGEVRFYGPLDDFHISADIVTSKGADITIPLNNSITLTENDFVVFINDEKDESVFDQEYSVEVKGLSLDFKIQINNTADVMIFLPSNMGNISSKGYGEIRFDINPRGEFNIYGDYNFLHGTFFFTLQNLINRRFEIVQGGKISFNGNPYNADVDLKALYKLKTTLSGLGASISPEIEGQRVNVNAYLGLHGKLANPDIHFSIDFPNVKDEISQVIYAVLDTNDVSLMNQQMLSLLVMNSFSYASSSGNMGASSLNIMTSQLSNWLSQISSDFDIGINYIPGDEINRDEVEVALSTQFFDNRLIVDGNVGVMTKDEQQQQASNIVGDVNIEYKLTPDGRIRLRAFNRSNNFNTIDYYAPYTQGVGIFYTKEFDRFGDIFKRQRKKRSEREAEVGEE